MTPELLGAGLRDLATAWSMAENARRMFDAMAWRIIFARRAAGLDMADVFFDRD